MKLSPLEQSILDSFPVGAKQLLVAVSGGVDSVTLLYALTRLSATLNVSLHAAHLDHQIRQESAADAVFVRDLCAQWNVPCDVESCAVADLAQQRKLSVEMAGRQARREFLQRLAVEVDADAISLAHHQDDQVETFMLRLLRGSGQSGLASMRVCQAIWWRPLLGCSREQILAYAQQHGLPWVEDQSNKNPKYLRNQLRHELIPQMLKINPSFKTQIAGLTQRIQVEEDYWQEQVVRQVNELALPCADGLRLGRDALLALHPALRVRTLREALQQVRGDLQRIEAIHLQAIEALLSGIKSQAQLNLPGCWVARRYDALWFRATAPELPSPFNLPLPLSGELELPDGRVLRTSTQDELEGESAWVTEYSLAALSQPLRVRSWLPGDRFVPSGMFGHKKLKSFFSDNQIEIEARLTMPLLVCGDTILWVVGARRSGCAVAGQGQGKVLRVELI
ncbi:tRNA lysidine(34) synthetase TilS [Desulfuromusa kysingii]|nr:tRNA lysidine(34) synthetase TilS [Desulfuromusa kysingii]